MAPPPPPELTERIGPWGDHHLAEGEPARIEIGPLTLHISHTGDELRLALERAAPAESGDDAGEDLDQGAEPPELEWTRWATTDWDGRYTLRPAFPDRPVVVAPEDIFHLLASARARIYVRVPLWVDLEVVGQKGRTSLKRIPILQSSDTWWGTPAEGELCYWIGTSARRAVTEDLFEDHLVMCPLQLVNRSRGDLLVEKIALRVDYLSLYASGRAIWADETVVRYQGEAEGSRLDVGGAPPREAPDAHLLATPRLAMARGFRARTFARIRSSFAGWGG